MASYPSSVAGFPTHSTGQPIASANENNIQAEIVALETALLSTGLSHVLQATGLRFSAATTLALSSNTNGTITPTLFHHAVDTAGAASSGSLGTITPGAVANGIALGAESLLLLTPANPAAPHVVTVVSSVGNIALCGQQPYVLGANPNGADALLLRFDGTNWVEIARGCTWGAWNTLSYATGWAAVAGQASIRYRIDPTGKLVYLSGYAVSSGNLSGVGNPITTGLPVGARPTAQFIGCVAAYSGAVGVVVTSGGAIYVASGNTTQYVPLDGLVFAVDN